MRIDGLNVLPETLRRCAQGGVKLVVIDTPPASTGSLGQVVKHADYVLIPTQDGISDISAISRTVEMAKELHKPVFHSADLHQQADYAVRACDGF